MSFFNNAFYNPARAGQFDNLFQLINEIDRAASATPASATPAQKQAKDKAPQKKTPEKPQKKEAASPQQPQQLLRHRADDSVASDLANLFGFGELLPRQRTFNPRFDVRETDAAYELHGELAGVERNNIHLEFTEPQTLVISGRVERNYTSGEPAAARQPKSVDEHAGEMAAPRSPSPARSLQAVVMEEEEEEALERGTDATEDKPMEDAPAPTTTVAKPKPAAAAAPAERYWVQERSVGQFKRVFNFPAPVDEANVRAGLENGVLHVTVPKAKRQARRIVVF